MGTVTIGGVTHQIYGELADPSTPGVADSADEYHAATFRTAATWAALTTTQRAQCLVEATRMLDRLPWRGTKTSEAQPLQWPRSGVTRRDGTAVSSASVPVEIEQACYELAYEISRDAAAVQSAVGVASSNVKRVRAGSAEVEFHRPVVAGELPTIVSGLVGQFRAGAADTAAAESYGTGSDNELAYSAFDEAADGYPIGRP